MHPNELNLECIQCLPTDDEIILVDGTCQACPDFTYVGPYQHECISDDCEAGEFKEDDGTCELCDIYTHPTIDG